MAYAASGGIEHLIPLVQWGGVAVLPRFGTLLSCTYCSKLYKPHRRGWGSEYAADSFLCSLSLDRSRVPAAAASAAGSV